MSTTPRIVDPITIELDRPRTFLLDLAGMAYAERELARFWGLPRVSLMKILKGGEIGVADMACILCGGMLRDDPTLTAEKMLNLLGQVDLQAAFDHLNAALAQQLGAKTKLKEGAGTPADPPPASSSTGPVSGPSADTTSA